MIISSCLHLLNLQPHNHLFIDYLTVSNQSSLFYRVHLMYWLLAQSVTRPLQNRGKALLLTVRLRNYSSLFPLACLGIFSIDFPTQCLYLTGSGGAKTKR